MIVRLPYGKNYLEASLPEERTTLLLSKSIHPVENLELEVEKALKKPINSPPLPELVKSAKIVTILIPDKTRNCPTKDILESLLKLLRMTTEAEINILIANGLHKPAIPSEIEELLGRDIISEYKVLNHNALEQDQLLDLDIRTRYSTPIVINKLVIESDIVIGIGLIEPHFFAGYSGGRKIILPGVAGATSIFSNHRYNMIAHPKARVGILKGNPVHEDMMEFMKTTKLDFIINVIVNVEKKVGGVFVGDPVSAHLEGVKLLEKYVKIPYSRPTDIVITTNGGYPLDRDIYQAVKGMDTAASVVKKGGVIIAAVECRDGLGGHEDFLRLVEGTSEPGEILTRIIESEPIPDQWQAHILARVMKKATIIVVSRSENEPLLKRLNMIPVKSLEEALEVAENIVGKKADITVIPEGPYIIPIAP